MTEHEQLTTEHTITVVPMHPMLGKWWQAHCSCGSYFSDLWDSPEGAEQAGREHADSQTANGTPETTNDATFVEIAERILDKCRKRRLASVADVETLAGLVVGMALAVDVADETEAELAVAIARAEKAEAEATRLRTVIADEHSRLPQGLDGEAGLGVAELRLLARRYDALAVEWREKAWAFEAENQRLRDTNALLRADVANATPDHEALVDECEQLHARLAELGELGDEWGVRYPGWYQGEEDPVDFCDDQADAEQLAASQPGTPTVVVRREVTGWRPAGFATGGLVTDDGTPVLGGTGCTWTLPSRAELATDAQPAFLITTDDVPTEDDVAQLRADIQIKPRPDTD
jgi:hypothetical protein